MFRRSRPNAPPPLPQLPVSGFVRLWQGVSFLALAVVLALGVADHCLNPTHGLLFAWLYSPKIWVAIALAILALPGWWFGRLLGAILMLMSLAWLGLGLHWRVPQEKKAAAANLSGRLLRVITCNRGESAGHDFFPFVKAHDPDILVIQQSRSTGAWTPDAAELSRRPNGVQVGEFLVRSRYPVLSQQALVVTAVLGKKLPAPVTPGLRCVVDAGKLGQIVVYNIHLPSPRQVLREMGIGAPRRRAVHLLDGNMSEVQSYWSTHQECARLLRESIRGETLPVLAMGDWNNPDFGPLYREMSSGLLDAHREAGEGFGYTFPDDVSHALAGGLPWMRIDYIFAGKSWQVHGCEVEPDAENAQHRAVAATLVLR